MEPYYTYINETLYLEKDCDLVEYSLAIEELTAKKNFPLKVFLTRSNYIRIFKDIKENGGLEGIINPYFNGKNAMTHLIHGYKKVYILTPPEKDDTLIY